MLKTKLSLLAHFLILSLTLTYFLLIKSYPLVASFGMESANLFVLVFGPLFCLLPSFSDSSSQKKSNFLDVLAPELFWLLISLAFISLLFFINGYYHLSCSEGSGFVPFLVVSAPPLLLNLVIGCLIAYFFKRLWLKIPIFLLFYFSYAALLLFCWWQEPSFRLLSHLAVIISSDLMQGDKVVPGIVGYRIATVLWAVFFIIIGLLLPGTNRKNAWSSKQHYYPLSLLTLSIIVSLFALGLQEAAKKSLGKSRRELNHDYQISLTKNDITVRANPTVTLKEDAQNILSEALLWQQRLKARLGKISNKPLTIWLHHDEADKFLYTGAKNVHFALPKHREIHIAGTTVPHHVLGHELAHIYVGEHSTTLFGLPGQWYLFPNMALTEGLAMAITKELTIENGLSLMEQAQALFQSNLKPDLRKLFKTNSVNFLSNDPYSSYIFSGALIEHYLSKHSLEKQPNILVNIIKAGSLYKIFSLDGFESLLSDFNQELAKPAPPYALLWAKKISPHSILAKDCLLTKNTSLTKLEEALFNQDQALALKSLESLQNLSPKEIIAIINQHINLQISYGNYDIALMLLDHMQKYFLNSSNDDSTEFLYKKVQVFCALSSYEMALNSLNEIDLSYLNEANQRQLLITKEFLEAIINKSELSPLYIAGLSYLYRSHQDQILPFAELSYFLGQADLGFKQALEPALLMAKYLHARTQMRLGDYNKALSGIWQLLENQHSLPKPIILELGLMLAKTHQELKHYQLAIDNYKEALGMAKTKASVIEIKDAIEHLYLQLSF